MKAGFVDFFFPRGAGCLVCGDPRRADTLYCLCPDCRRELLSLRLRENVCIRCMHPLDGAGLCPFCREERLGPMTAGYGAYRYTGAARQLVRALKFHFQDEAADALAAGMSQCVPLNRYDVLTPVPLHPARQRVRGINQARLLCDLVGRRLDLPTLDALIRTRRTNEQARIREPGARQRNVRGAFACRGEVKGLRVLLVDDVRTTGATARACAEALLRGGAAEVAVLTATIATAKHMRKEGKAWR